MRIKFYVYTHRPLVEVGVFKFENWTLWKIARYISKLLLCALLLGACNTECSQNQHTEECQVRIHDENQTEDKEYTYGPTITPTRDNRRN